MDGQQHPVELNAWKARKLGRALIRPGAGWTVPVSWQLRGNPIPDMAAYRTTDASPTRRPRLHPLALLVNEHQAAIRLEIDHVQDYLYLDSDNLDKLIALLTEPT